MNPSTFTTANANTHSTAPRWRRWPFGEPPWRKAIRNSELPPQVQRLLVEVVAGTRLLANEKLEVAEELIAHFEDGLQRGRSVASLIEAFGDPEIASQLIRNGKQRTRSMKNRLVQGSLWLGALSAGGFLTLVIMFYMGKPQPSVDYLAVINKPALEAADHDKGWTIYRDLWLKHGFVEGGTFNLETHFQNSKGEYTRLLRPSDGPAWDALVNRLASMEDLLEGFRVGGVRPSFGIPVYIDPTQYSEADFRVIYPKANDEARKAMKRSPTDTFLNTSLPHIQVVRWAAYILVVDTRWAIQRGDVERATRNIEAMFGISKQVSESRLLVCSFVGLAVQNHAMGVIDECLQSNVSFDDQQLARMQAAISNARTEDMIDLSGERATFMDLIQKAYTDDGHGDGRITAHGMQQLEDLFGLEARFSNQTQNSDFDHLLRRTMAPASILVLASRKQVTEKAEKLFDRLEKQLYSCSSIDGIQVIDEEIKALPAAYIFIKKALPSFRHVSDAIVRSQGNTRGLLAAIAVIRYQLQHGRLPETLDELVGDFLGEVPMDPLDEQPLRYQVKGDEFVIYSVGVNRVDDGGQPVLIRPDGSLVADPTQEKDSASLRSLPAGSYIMQHDYPGDWILWPRLSGQDD